MSKDTLTIDIVSDVVCPWCVVGYKRLQRALAEFPDLDVQLAWHPFELNPGMPEEGQDLTEHIAEKYGSTAAESASNRAYLAEVGRSLDFTIKFEDGARIVNTFNAHQLLHWAGLEGKQTELELALFEAYFSRNENVNDLAVLLGAVEAVGLDRAEAGRMLEDRRYAAVVREKEQYWLGQGVRAVPTMVFNGRYAVSGAREPEELAEMIERSLEIQHRPRLGLA